MFEGGCWVVLFCQVGAADSILWEARRRALSAASFCLSVACFVVASHDFFGQFSFHVPQERLEQFSENKIIIELDLCHRCKIFFHTSIQSASARSYQTWNKTSEMEASRSRWSARNPPVSRSPEEVPQQWKRPVFQCVKVEQNHPIVTTIFFDF